MKTLLLVLATALLSACQVYLRVDSVLLAQREGGLYALAPGDRIGRGDMFAIEMLIDRPAHVYVVHVDQTGAQVRLFPEHDDEPMIADVPLRVPVRGFFKPASSTGPGNFVVVINKQPLSQLTLRQHVQREQAAPRRRHSRTTSPHKVETHEAPGSIGEVRGADEIKSIASELGTRVEVGSSGTATLSLWLNTEENPQGPTKTKGAQ